MCGERVLPNAYRYLTTVSSTEHQNRLLIDPQIIELSIISKYFSEVETKDAKTSSDKLQTDEIEAMIREAINSDEKKKLDIIVDRSLHFDESNISLINKILSYYLKKQDFIPCSKIIKKCLPYRIKVSESLCQQIVEGLRDNFLWNQAYTTTVYMILADHKLPNKLLFYLIGAFLKDAESVTKALELMELVVVRRRNDLEMEISFNKIQNFAASLPQNVSKVNIPEKQIDHLFEQCLIAMDSDGWVPIALLKASVALSCSFYNYTKTAEFIRRSVELAVQKNLIQKFSSNPTNVKKSKPINVQGLILCYAQAYGLSENKRETRMKSVALQPNQMEINELANKLIVPVTLLELTIRFLNEMGFLGRGPLVTSDIMNLYWILSFQSRPLTTFPQLCNTIIKKMNTFQPFLTKSRDDEVVKKHMKVFSMETFQEAIEQSHMKEREIFRFVARFEEKLSKRKENTYLDDDEDVRDDSSLRCYPSSGYERRLVRMISDIFGYETKIVPFYEVQSAEPPSIDEEEELKDSVPLDMIAALKKPSTSKASLLTRRSILDGEVLISKTPSMMTNQRESLVRDDFLLGFQTEVIPSFDDVLMKDGSKGRSRDKKFDGEPLFWQHVRPYLLQLTDAYLFSVLHKTNNAMITYASPAWALLTLDVCRQKQTPFPHRVLNRVLRMCAARRDLFGLLETIRLGQEERILSIRSKSGLDSEFLRKNSKFLELQDKYIEKMLHIHMKHAEQVSESSHLSTNIERLEDEDALEDDDEEFSTEVETWRSKKSGILRNGLKFLSTSDWNYACTTMHELQYTRIPSSTFERSFMEMVKVMRECDVGFGPKTLRLLLCFLVKTTRDSEAIDTLIHRIYRNENEPVTYIECWAISKAILRDIPVENYFFDLTVPFRDENYVLIFPNRIQQISDYFIYYQKQLDDTFIQQFVRGWDNLQNQQGRMLLVEIFQNLMLGQNRSRSDMEYVEDNLNKLENTERKKGNIINSFDDFKSISYKKMRTSLMDIDNNDLYETVLMLTIYASYLISYQDGLHRVAYDLLYFTWNFHKETKAYRKKIGREPEY